MGPPRGKFADQRNHHTTYPQRRPAATRARRAGHPALGYPAGLRSDYEPGVSTARGRGYGGHARSRRAAVRRRSPRPWPRPPRPTAPGAGALAAARPETALTRLTAARCLELFEVQLGSRHLDLAARWLREPGRRASTPSARPGTRATPASPRRCGPPTRRCCTTARAPSTWPGPRRRDACPGRRSRDVLLGLVAAAEEPIAGGRHKVFGHPDLDDHPADLDDRLAPAPRGRRGLRHRARRASSACAQSPWPDDAIVVCSFGDASVNHSTAAGALNTAAYCAYQGLPLPILFVCEDNGIGISVRTPPGWIERGPSGPAPSPTSRPTAATWPTSTTWRRAAAEYVRDAPRARLPAPAARSG